MDHPSIFDSSLEKQSDALAAVCPVMKSIIADKGYISLSPKSDHFLSLCQAICSQQLSTKAAATIFERFRLMLDNNISPQNVLKQGHDALRSCGLSNSKVNYIRDLAEHFHAQPELYEKLEFHTDDAIITELTAIKGIGKWSAQMFLIFSLGRPDVFPEDDLGIRNAVNLHFPESQTFKRQEYLSFSERWESARTLASLYLWKSLS